MKLGEKQRIFTKLVAKLILQAYDAGYEISFGEAFAGALTKARGIIRKFGTKPTISKRRLHLDVLPHFEAHEVAAEEAKKCVEDLVCQWLGSHG